MREKRFEAWQEKSKFYVRNFSKVVCISQSKQNFAQQPNVLELLQRYGVHYAYLKTKETKRFTTLRLHDIK